MGFSMVFGGLVVDQCSGERYGYGICVPGKKKLVVYAIEERI